MKAIIICLILNVFTIGPAYTKNIKKQSKKYTKYGIHLPNKSYSQSKIQEAINFFNYKKGYQIIKKVQIENITKHERNQILVGTSSIKGDHQSDWSLFHYTILKNTVDKKRKLKKVPLKFYFYESNVEFSLSKKRPLLLMTPTIRGVKNGIYVNIEPKWAEHFASQGYHVLVVQLGDSFLSFDRSLKELDHWVKDKVIDQRILVDFANTTLKDKIDTDKIIAYGSSLGGIRSIITMALEKDRIALGVTVAAGANFADLFVTTKQEEVALYRDHRMKIEGFAKDYPILKDLYPSDFLFITKKLKKYYKGLDPENPDELDIIMNRESLYSYVKKITRTEPLLFAKERDFKNDLLMYISLSDSKVRSKTQIELWEALGQPHYYKNGKIFKNHGPFILQVARTKLTEVQQWIEGELFKRGLINSTRIDQPEKSSKFNFNLW